jgi:hypothetical protein
VSLPLLPDVSSLQPESSLLVLEVSSLQLAASLSSLALLEVSSLQSVSAPFELEVVDVSLEQSVSEPLASFEAELEVPNEQSASSSSPP